MSTAPRPPLPPNSLPPEKRFVERRVDGPRRIKNGMRLSSREGPVARTALAGRWLRLIESRLDADGMGTGLEYARAGQIASLQILAGEIDARVQGTAARPYVVRIGVTALNEAQWQRLIDAMAVEAIHVAKLLSGELPPGLDELFAEHGSALLPPASSLQLACTCEAASANHGACKHVAAAAHLVADQLSDQPLLIFTLLGMPAERLIERLRQARLLETQGVASAHGQATMQAPSSGAPPLESLLEDFWRGAGEIEDLSSFTPRESVKHALLRRLGPSPLQGKFPMVGLLASIYDAVSEAARRRGDGA